MLLAPHTRVRDICNRAAADPSLFEVRSGNEHSISPLAQFPRARLVRRMSYEISIRPNRPGKAPAHRGAIGFVFAQFPELRRESPDVLVYTAPNGRSSMRIQLGQTDPVEIIRVNIPEVLLRADGGTVLRLCFKIADQLGWGILDEHLGGYIERDAIPDILKRYEYAGETVTEFLDRRALGRAGFTDMFRFHLLPQTRKGMLISIVLASLIAGIMVVRLDVSATIFPWFGGAAFLAIVSAKSVVQSIREMRRRGS